MNESTATAGTGGTWAGTMHSGGVDSRGQMIWHFGPLEECWCSKTRATRCNHVCSEHPPRPSEEGK